MEFNRAPVMMAAHGDENCTVGLVMLYEIIHEFVNRVEWPKSCRVCAIVSRVEVGRS